MFRLTRLRFAAPAALLLTLAACSHDTDATPAATAPATHIGIAYELPDTQAYPESIAADARSGAIYVSSFLDGAVYRATPGKQQAEVFLPAGTDGRQTANGVKVDAAGRLWVIDHTHGVAVYDTGTRALIARFDVREAQPFVNDLAITADGTVYLTDSVRPVIYRITPQQFGDAVAHGGRGELSTFSDLGPAKDAAAQQPITLNGLVADPAGRYLLAVDMPNGDLYRVALDGQRQIRKVTLHGGNMVDGDGLELRGDTLWVVHNKSDAISRWRITDDGANAELQQRLTDPALDIPTSIVHVGDHALVSISQFDKNGPYGAGTPAPFTVAAVDGI
ncbi:SMP-30/gluconolactonase/LRE family protein [Nocardia sp. NPDC006630]|uniref:SMP-30/gluconolactonase/LRE family protein n=1 Tax=Nocardia sp. NPDC006630 TaxID=3157181 RepID=UPI0033A15750